MKLELKHLAPYLPYSLQLQRENRHCVNKIIHMNNGNIMYPIEKPDKCKPILRPLSELRYGSKWFNYIYEITTGFHWENSVGELLKHPKEVRDMWPQYILEYLFANHFDVFGLIDAGLAIDINTI